MEAKKTKTIDLEEDDEEEYYTSLDSRTHGKDTVYETHH